MSIQHVILTWCMWCSHAITSCHFYVNYTGWKFHGG